MGKLTFPVACGRHVPHVACPTACWAPRQRFIGNARCNTPARRRRLGNGFASDPAAPREGVAVNPTAGGYERVAGGIAAAQRGAQQL